jgi:glycosyltransferase involved in cell wall biosynthesis
MQKKKIVYIAQSAGGVEEYLYMFLKNFHDENYENFLIVSQDYEINKERFINFVKDLYIVPMQREVQLKKDLKSIKEIKKILKKIKPDIVYLHSSKAGALGRIALLFNFKTKIIYNAHGWYFNADISNKKRKIFALIEKILAIKTKKIINISKNEYESALQHKIAPKKKMCIIENGIDFTKFANNEQYRERTRKELNIKDNEIVIGVVGRLTEQKDPITMIKAFNEVYKENKKVKLMYVGSGNLEDEVIKFARDNNILDRIVITGWVSNVAKYIPAFDIAVLPSKWEGFGLAIIEYMACDKPIIATNVGGILNIIKNGENGLLINKEDTEQLREKILELINNKELYNNIIKINKEEKEKYDINIMLKKNMKIIEEVLN